MATNVEDVVASTTAIMPISDILIAPIPQTYYAAYNSDGAICGYYHSTHSPLPAGVVAIAITEAEWQESLATPGYTVVNGVLTPPTPPTSEEVLATAIAKQTKSLSSDCFNFITLNGLPVTINGTQYMVGANQVDQNNLNTMSVTNMAVANSPLWTAGTVVEPGTTVIVNGTYIITKAGGTTGSTEPAAPTEFQVGITDGTVTWYLYGNYVALTGGGAMWVTLQQFKAAYAQGVAYLTDMRAVYHSLVNSMTNMPLDQISSVVWPFTTVAEAIQFVGFSTTNTISASS